MIEDKATERLKERLKKLGLIVNAGANKPKLDTVPKAKAETPKGGKRDGKK
ncbi:MAG TPA: hypothetical protein VGC87_17535 [Pyrinomonadaceae bacterium]|jgi:hypothetical protein